MKRFVVLRIPAGALAAVVMVLSTVLFPVPAFAAVPSGELNPGSYTIADFESGQAAVNGSLVVSNADWYTQTLNVTSGAIELWLIQYTASFNIGLEQMSLGGLYFTSNGQALPTLPPPVLYRDYNAPGVLAPGDSWSFNLLSTSGGVTIHDQSVVKGPEFVESSSGTVTEVQEIDSTLTLGGNGSGVIDVVQYETPGSPNQAYVSYISEGPLTVLGSTSEINTEAVLGGLL